MKRKLLSVIAVVLLTAGLVMLIAPRISNHVGEQIAHTTIEDFKALKSKATSDEPTEKKDSSDDSPPNTNPAADSSKSDHDPDWQIEDKESYVVMNYAEFVRQLERLNDGDVYVSPDFQCDRTGGYPTSLCVNWDKCKAWLQLNDSIDADGVDVAEYEQLCAEFGIRDCFDTEQYNQILSSLGEDAVQSASLPEDEEDFSFNL